MGKDAMTNSYKAKTQFVARLFSGASLGSLLFVTALLFTIGILPLLLDIRSLGSYDFTQQQIPFILETKRMLASGAPWWSWNTFSGDNFIGAYGFYTLTSPFVWIICLFPIGKMMWGLLLAFYLKSMCTSAFAYVYFRKMSFNNETSCIGGLLYSFSSFYICNLFYFHFAEPIMVFPLLLTTIECVVRGEQRCYVWLALASFAVVFVNFYFALPSMILGGLYYFCRTIGRGGLRMLPLIKTVGAVVLGVLLASFVLLPIVMHTAGSSRTSVGDWAYIYRYTLASPRIFVRYYATFLRSFIMPDISEFIVGDSILLFRFHISREPFITMFGLLPVAIYMIRRKGWLKWLLATLLVIAFTPLNGIFTLYTNPEYFRWLYGFVLLGILATLYVIKDGIRISGRELLVYIILCMDLVLFIIIYSHLSSVQDAVPFYICRQNYTALILFAVNILCLTIWVFNRKRMVLTFWMVGLCGCLNLMAFTRLGDNDSGLIPANNRGIYQGLLLEDYFNSKDEPYGYRYDDVSFYSNVGMLHDRPGIYSFHSVYNSTLYPFRNKFDWYSDSPTFANHKGSRMSVAALMSVKEVRNFKDSLQLGHRHEGGLTLQRQTPYYDEYTFDYYIPMGFSYDTYVTSEELEKALAENDSTDIALLLLDNLVIKKEDEAALGKYLRKGEVNDSATLNSVVSQRRAFTAFDFKGDSKGFRAITDFDKERVLFFSVAADPGFTAYIDNMETPIYNVNLGMSAIVVPSGRHEIRFSYLPPGLKTGCIISSAALLVLIGMIIYPSLTRRRRCNRVKVG